MKHIQGLYFTIMYEFDGLDNTEEKEFDLVLP